MRRIEEEGKIEQASQELERSSRVSEGQSKGEQKFKLPKLVISPFKVHILQRQPSGVFYKKDVLKDMIRAYFC